LFTELKRAKKWDESGRCIFGIILKLENVNVTMKIVLIAGLDSF
jgi:hypothetical protein